MSVVLSCFCRVLQHIVIVLVFNLLWCYLDCVEFITILLFQGMFFDDIVTRTSNPGCLTAFFLLESDVTFAQSTACNLFFLLQLCAHIQFRHLRSDNCVSLFSWRKSLLPSHPTTATAVRLELVRNCASTPLPESDSPLPPQLHKLVKILLFVYRGSLPLHQIQQ